MSKSNLDTNKIAIYQSEDGTIQLNAKVEDESIWLTQAQIVELFQSSKSNINEHISQILKENELDDSTIRNFRTVQKEGRREVSRNLTYYNLDMIISVGYRVKSKIATKFRKWATQTLRDYIVQGYVLNDQRLKEKEGQLETIKKAINLIERGISHQIENIEQAKQLNSFLSDFAKSFELLDHYDHEKLDKKGKTKSKINAIEQEEFLSVIDLMKNEFDSEIFGQAKDESFASSVNQIYQSFGDMECYPTVEEKAATLLYLIVKNHSFIDGNKRIAAACFLYFLNKNGILAEGSKFIIDNNTLFALTILVAESTPSEMNLVKNMVITILNRR
jgi:prophage maintenance system killer protein/prophage antirepressor-like protein